MNARLRAQRNVFHMFVGGCVLALAGALPLVAAQTKSPSSAPPAATPAAAKPSAGAEAGSTADQPTFADADRNKDGLLDKSEAGRVPGLSANFERADANRDGKLDEVEFARGLEILRVRR